MRGQPSPKLLQSEVQIDESNKSTSSFCEFLILHRNDIYFLYAEPIQCFFQLQKRDSAARLADDCSH
jgi:hypothetical protein